MAQQQEKKKRLSFLGKIFRSSKKSASKDTSTSADDSFRRQCALYHSFHSTNALQDNNISSDEAGNFTTLENSAFMDMHKDAGIIFLNKNSITNSVILREEDRHVQFVPTPMNKYYNVDVKSAPAKIVKKDENKENVGLNKSLKPTRPILRFGKSRENLPQKEDYKSNKNLVDSGKLKLNVTYMDGPQVKQTPTIPRTSTKTALLDRKNGSMPLLNISEIAKYGSLPRSTKTSDERYRSGNEVQVQGDSYDIKSKLFFPPVENRNLGFNRPLPEAGIQSKYLRKTDKTGCKSISDIPRHVEQRRFLQQGVCNDPNVAHRYNIGETHMVVQTRSQDCQPLKIVNDNLHKFGNMNCFNQVNCQLPNKAINEIGLPSNAQSCQEKFQGTSDSPHYIPLAEAYSSSGHVKQIQSENQKTQTGYYLKNSDFVRPNTRKQLPIPLNNGPRNSLNTTNMKLTNVHHNPAVQETMTIEEYSHFVSQARNQVIRSSMISHRRKFVNKICKYKSKECEDGFSSMADDECSFNCSCSSCLAKFSRDYKKNMNRNSLHLNADDKFFFITTDEHERAPLPTVPEIPLRTENGQNISVNGKVQSAETTWYECNDSLCKTPKTNEDVTEGTTAILTPRNFQEDRLVESIYENITQIINSATKRNFKKQDIQTMFSTPLSRSKVTKEVAEVTSNKKVSRALFASADNLASSQTKHEPSSTKSPVAFSDSVILLQEIFQKLSQECRELLQPNASSATPINQQGSSNQSQMSVSSSGSKYVNDLVKNLRSKEISEGDFASIIGGIAQNIFLEAKLKQKVLRISHSTSLPDLTKEELQPKIQSASSVENIPKCSESQIKESGPSGEDNVDMTTISSTASDNLNDRSQPYGWSKSPTSTTENSSGDSNAEHSNSSKDDSRTSDSDAQILEMAIRLGMGLSPISKEEKTTYFSASPAKATKYKSKDVLSGKGKLKLKIYHNSGLVTVNVMRAAKLNRINGKDLNPYIKISMVPDCSKRVHWRTSVQKGYKNPIFNQKFSFEILAEDITKRLVFSVWHRDFIKERSELVGCMSFSVRHVMDDSHKIDGWYRLLREGFGTQKHFAAHTRSNSCSLKQVKQGF